MFDICIVGSGPSGVISAKSLVEKGYKVCLVDVGIDSTYNVPFKHFHDQRAEDSTFFYPPDEKTFSTDSAGAQITKAREHLLKLVPDYLKIKCENFSPFQTLATGGLSAAWGASCFTYSDADLKRASLEPLQLYYEAAARIIGISGPKQSHFCKIKNKQKPAMLDHNGQSILSKRQQGLVLEQSSIALLTEPLNERSPNPHFDMDFYANFGNSVFRSDYLLNDLEKHQNFTRIQHVLVTAFKETFNQVEVQYLNIQTSATATLTAKKLIICAGALNSYRLVANSLQVFNTPNPILCNPYLLIPTIHLPSLGKEGAYHRHSLSQLFGESLANPQVTLQFYSYRSLLLSRLIEQTPMPPFFGRLFWRSLCEALVIIGTHFADDGKSPRSIQAEPCNALAALKIAFSDSANNGKFSIAKNLIKLACIPLNMVKTIRGSSIHYAGTIPISNKGNYPIGMNQDGLVHSTKNVYVFDSSGWTYLPSRGLTFTIMANALRLCEKLHKEGLAES